MNYPAINLEDTNQILEIIEATISDPSYLNPENCPYDPKIVARIRGIIDACVLVEVKGEDDKKKVGRPQKNQIQDMEEVEKELDDLRKELAQMKIDQEQMATSDRIQIFKVRASIIERMIGMKERVISMKQQLRFIDTVIGIMNDHMDQETREKIIKELKPFAEGEA